MGIFSLKLSMRESLNVVSKIFGSVAFVGAFVCMSSCIQSDPLNAECDIEEVYVEIADWDSLFYTENDMVKEVFSAESVIVFSLRDGFTDWEKLSAVPVYFKITEGATIWPESGSTQDFSEGAVRYTVTSQDGAYHRVYYVKFNTIESVETEQSFENYELHSGGRYYLWFEYDENGDTIWQWATGNAGYAISRSSAGVSEFPTLPWTEDAVDGSAVKLETCATGSFGVMVNMRLAAGSLFIGQFDVDYALRDAMKATRFGMPFNRKPISFEGYYKYKPGSTFQLRDGSYVEGRIDEPDLYSVIFKNTDENGNSIMLEGDNVLTHENIVGLARVTNHVYDFSTWTYYNIPFEYYSELDENLLRNYGYSITVVFTSSVGGASFEGSIGSVLVVDEVKVNCEE